MNVTIYISSPTPWAEFAKAYKIPVDVAERICREEAYAVGATNEEMYQSVKRAVDRMRALAGESEAAY